MTKEQNNEEIIIPEKFKDLIEKIEALNIVELSELVKVLEKKFGVSATVPMAVFPVAAAATVKEDSETEEKTSFSVELKNAGGQKIQVIKVIKEILGIGLKESKDFVDASPKMVKEGLSKEQAEEIKKKLEEAGAMVEIK